ncbi:MAG: TMEM165/GDT1 family protein [Sphingomonadaceae bacterium]|nr:TMEM165/GDT1 family protein [Sphingomonadaceae bacterium]
MTPAAIVLTSLAVVALAEIGDRTMLLAILLSLRFRRPLPVILGILVATIANHLVAAWAGASIAGLLDGFWFRLAVAIGFLAMAAWTLIPDKMDDPDKAEPARRGAFVTTLVAFFLVEIGDKTQIATIALGARYEAVPHAIELVATGTTLGMMIVNAPAVLFGERITRIVPLAWVRVGAALVLAGLGVAGLVALFGGR